MKKKLLSVLLAAVCVVSMAACGGKSNDTAADTESSDTSDAADGAVTAKVIDFDLTNEEYAFGVDKEQPELLEKANAFIDRIQEDGTLEAICENYFGAGEPKAVKSAELDESKDQLVVATNAAFEPFEFTKGEDYYGVLWKIKKSW